jgi:hypothetical protein
MAGSMNRRLALAAAALALVVTPSGHGSPAAPSTALARSCSSGFRHAVIDGAQKCLRRGEFCAHAYDHRAPRRWPYKHYGYRCIKRDPRGRYHLT